MRAALGPRVNPLRRRLGDLLLGTDPLRRRHVGRNLLGDAMYLAALMGQLVGVAFGFIDRMALTLLAVIMLCGVTVLFLLIRSGWSDRFDDPSMTDAQLAFGLCALTAAYPVDGPLRGLNLLCVSLLPLFGFFAMTPRKGLAVITCILVLFGGTMLTLAWTDPVRFDPRVEAIHFAILAVCMPAMWMLLRTIGRMRNRVLAHKLELSLALERIEAVSIRDELTGLYNRRYMAARLDDEGARRGRDGAAYCLCVIDIDHFKRINDGHGHARGDAVLQRFAHLLQTHLRDVDVLARWGGEEFLLLLPGTSAPAALAQLERLRELVAEAANWGDDAALRVRFSAGLAEDDHEGVPQVLERADRALYSAKAGGRNRVMHATLQAA